MQTKRYRNTSNPAMSPSATEGWLGRFRADTSGNMSYVALAGSLVMMVFGGIGIDMMHAELKRSQVQNTLDRAVLAAANLSNTRDPQTVVEDYFRAMKLEDTLGDVQTGDSLGAKRVRAEGNGTINSHFLGLIGIDQLDVHGAATAENATAPLEISLVLDVSGSMQGQKIKDLKEAAKTFVHAVLGEGGDNSRVTVSLVPYNATVNLGDDLSERFNLDRWHNYSSCAIFDASDYSSLSIDPDSGLEQLAHFDPFDGNAPDLTDPWCAAGNDLAIVPHSSDPDYLSAVIDSFEAQGNTAIDLGMKWGLALLDPAARPVIGDMQADGLVPSSARYRPSDYCTQTMKCVVVMTDGENTQEYNLKSWMLNPTALSNVWVDDHGTPGKGDDRYSIRVKDNYGDSNDVFFWPHASSYRYKNGPYSWVTGTAAQMVNGVAVVGGDSETTKAKCSSYKGAGHNAGQETLIENVLGVDYGTLDLDGDGIVGAEDDCTSYPPVRLTWQELFGNVKTTWYANSWYWQAYVDGRVSYNDYYNAYYSWETIVNASQANTNLSTICAKAKQQDVTIFTIGVEAPQAGLAAMRNCASSASHYYNVDSSQLVDTFRSISDVVVELRLTE